MKMPKKPKWISSIVKRIYIKNIIKNTEKMNKTKQKTPAEKID